MALRVRSPAYAVYIPVPYAKPQTAEVNTRVQTSGAQRCWLRFGKAMLNPQHVTYIVVQPTSETCAYIVGRNQPYCTPHLDPDTAQRWLNTQLRDLELCQRGP